MSGGPIESSFLKVQDAAEEMREALADEFITPPGEARELVEHSSLFLTHFNR